MLSVIDLFLLEDKEAPIGGLYCNPIYALAPKVMHGAEINELGQIH